MQSTSKLKTNQIVIAKENELHLCGLPAKFNEKESWKGIMFPVFSVSAAAETCQSVLLKTSNTGTVIYYYGSFCCILLINKPRCFALKVSKDKELN